MKTLSLPTLILTFSFSDEHAWQIDFLDSRSIVASSQVTRWTDRWADRKVDRNDERQAGTGLLDVTSCLINAPDFLLLRPHTHNVSLNLFLNLLHSLSSAQKIHPLLSLWPPQTPCPCPLISPVSLRAHSLPSTILIVIFLMYHFHVTVFTLPKIFVAKMWSLLFLSCMT